VSAIRGLESIRRRLKAHADTAADCALQEQIDILRAALDDTRQTIQQLRAPETTDMRVFIRQTAERVAQRLGAQLHCDCPDPMPTLTPLQTLMLTRVMQEALSNVMKHAGRPQNLWVACDWRDGWLEMRVADDGDGFDPATALEGMGLNNMRERIRALGGELTITSALGARHNRACPRADSAKRWNGYAPFWRKMTRACSGRSKSWRTTSRALTCWAWRATANMPCNSRCSSSHRWC
jgi:signal transduction histidine kinase